MSWSFWAGLVLGLGLGNLAPQPQAVGRVWWRLGSGLRRWRLQREARKRRESERAKGQ